jgi:hypothetical protein
MNVVIFAIPHPRAWIAPKLSIQVEFGIAHSDPAC